MHVGIKPQTRRALMQKAYSFVQPSSLRLSQTVFGPSPPNIFVGRAGYPRVDVGPLVSVAAEPWEVDAEFFDSPSKWYGLDYAKIIGMRSSLVRGKKKHGVKSESKMLTALQETVVSQKSVDLEVKFERPLQFSMDFSSFYQPMGPSGAVEKVSVAGNPSVPKKVDELAQEKVKVRQAVPELLSSGLDVYYLQKVLSAGILGEEKKLVPTRWSITAGDRMVADHFLESVKQSPCVNEYAIYSSEFLHNHFEVLLLPGRWEFEQFEAWAPGTVWTKGETAPVIMAEYEPYAGRSDYAELEGGGYYAGRLGAAEALHEMGKQARVVIFREIHEEYQIPVGVWQVREQVRQAFKKPPTKCTALKDAFQLLNSRLRLPVSAYYAKSKVLGQKKIFDF